MVQEEEKMIEDATKGIDVSTINFDALALKVFEEINKVRENPKSIVK